MAPQRRILVDPVDIDVRHEAVAGLPVVNAVLARLGFDALVGDYLPEPDARCGLEPARTIGVVVRTPGSATPSMAQTHVGAGVIERLRTDGGSGRVSG